MQLIIQNQIKKKFLINIKDSNIAIVHDWFIQKSFGGAEKVTFILNELLKTKYSDPDFSH